jgi:pyruvate dehydrogenase E1 component beta subunit
MQTEPREITFYQALLEGTEQCMEKDPSVYVMGLGVDDPKGIFGTTLGLDKKFSSKRSFDVPISENALTGMAIGSATMGLRPVLTHQRLDFALLSLDQIINNAAKWHFMFAGQIKCPITIRMLIGRGWGQGPQHSQSYQSLFAHIPGLVVVMPSTPKDAKGLLISSIESNSPVIFLEHRWLYNMKAAVPTEYYSEPLGKAKVVREGKDLTIVATSYMVFEAFRAANMLASFGVDVEVIDLRTIRPFDGECILKSVKKTGHLIIADTGHKTCGFSAEISAYVTENAFGDLKSAPRRVASPDYPVPTSPALALNYYPRSSNIAEAVLEILKVSETEKKNSVLKGLKEIESKTPSDVPDLSFAGPF